MLKLTFRLNVLFFLACSGVASAAAPIPAGKSGAIPTELPVLSNSLLVVQLNGFEKTKGKIESFLKSALPKSEASLREKLNKAIHEALEGHELKGISKEGRHYFAVHDFMQLEEAVSIAIPCDDSKAFLNAFFPKDKVTNREKKEGFEKIESENGTVYVIERVSHVILTFSEDLAGEYSKKFDSFKTKSMGDTAELFFQSDVSLYLNLEQISEIHGEQIKQAQILLNQAMTQAAQAEQIGIDRQQFEKTKLIYTGIFQMIEDGQSLSLGIDLRPDGVLFRSKAVFKPSSPTGKLLVLEKPSKPDLLNRLPQGSMIYSANMIGSGVAGALANLNREYYAADSDDAGNKRLQEWMSLQSQATSSLSYGDLGQVTVIISQHAKAKESVNAFASAMKSLEEGGKYQTIKIKGKPTVAEKAEAHRGFQLNRITLKLDYEETFKVIPEQIRKSLIEAVKRITPETLTIWMGAKDGQIIQVVSVKSDWTAAKNAIDAIFENKPKIGDHPSAKSTIALLPSENSQLVLFEVGKGINFAMDYFSSIMSSMAAAGVSDLPKLKAVKAEPTYAGIAFVMKGNSAAVDAYLPHQGVGIIAEMIAPLMGQKEQNLDQVSSNIRFTRNP